MNRIDELRQQIDACRAGGDDLHRPELAELRRLLAERPSGDGSAADSALADELARVQQFDRAVVSALHDVTVPAGLLDKLLAQTSRAGADEPGEVLTSAITSNVAAITEDGPRPSAAPAIDASPLRQRMLSRRTLALAGGGLVAATLLGLGYYSWLLTPRRVSDVELATEVTNWIGQLSRSADWRPGAPPPAITSRFPTNYLRTGVDRWKQIETSRREPAAVYELAPLGNATAWLVVVDTPHRYTVATSPYSPLPSISGGYSVGAWQRTGGQLYVLVVAPGGRPVRDYLLLIKAA